MDNKARLAKLKETKYLELFGVCKPPSDKMLEILEGAYKEPPGHGGRPPRLSVLDKLVITLGYYHDCWTMGNIAFDYGVSKSRISEAMKWVENTLVQDGTFALPPKRELLKSEAGIIVAIVEAAECETECP